MKTTLSLSDQPWAEIRNTDSGDGNFSRHNACLAWAAQLSKFVFETIGKDPAARVYTYIVGSSTYLAIDLFANNSRDSISITVLLRGKGFYLSTPRDRQIDIELAGIVDSLYLIKHLISNSSSHLIDHSLWVMPRDRLAA